MISRNIENKLKSFLPENFKIKVGFIKKNLTPFGKEYFYTKEMLPERKSEFLSARYYARSLLEQFKVYNFEILTGEFGEPIWPDGITGSISHENGIVIVILSNKINSNFEIGIDILDLNKDFSNFNKNLVFSEIEKDLFKNNNSGYSQFDFKLVFSLKESIVKCVSPLFKEYISFEEIILLKDGSELFAKIGNNRLNLFFFREQHYLITFAKNLTF